MAKKPRNRIALAQNFLRSSKLVRALIATSSIGPFDTVYEIGSGRGIITAELARTAHRVIAIEKDPAFALVINDPLVKEALQTPPPAPASKPTS